MLIPLTKIKALLERRKNRQATAWLGRYCNNERIEYSLKTWKIILVNIWTVRRVKKYILRNQDLQISNRLLNHSDIAHLTSTKQKITGATTLHINCNTKSSFKLYSNNHWTFHWIHPCTISINRPGSSQHLKEEAIWLNKAKTRWLCSVIFFYKESMLSYPNTLLGMFHS